MLSMGLLRVDQACYRRRCITFHYMYCWALAPETSEYSGGVFSTSSDYLQLARTALMLTVKVVQYVEVDVVGRRYKREKIYQARACRTKAAKVTASKETRDSPRPPITDRFIHRRIEVLVHSREDLSYSSSNNNYGDQR